MILKLIIVTMLAFFQEETVNYLKPENLTATSNFILLLLSKEDDIQPLLFGLCLLICLVGIIGNLFIILAIGFDFHLWTPMYFFLCNLSFTDICFIFTTVLKMLVNIIHHLWRLPHPDVFFHVFFFSGLDSLLLTVMFYDQCVAICHPLCYINPLLCGLLLLLSWLICRTYSLLQTLMSLRVCFCKKTEIHHYFYEPAQIPKLACSDTHANDVLLYHVTGLLGILFSYSKSSTL